MSNDKVKWGNDIFVFDNLRFISIFAICFHHGYGFITGGILAFVAHAVIAFAIPVFAFTSGYGQKNLKDTNFFRKIIAIYLMANLLYIPHYIWSVSKLKETPNFVFLIIGPSMLILWYFLALIVWRMIAPFVMQFRWPLLFSVVLSVLVYSASELLIGSKPSYGESLILTSLRLTIRSFPFYILGVITTREHVIQLRRSQFKYLLFIPAGFGLYLCGVEILQNNPMNNSFWQCIGYIFFASACASALVSVAPGGNIKHITSLGQRTFGIYIFHIYVLRGFIAIASLHMVTARFALHNQALQMLLYVLLVYVVCYLSSRAVLMTYFNKAAHWLENMIFGKTVKIIK